MSKPWPVKTIGEVCSLVNKLVPFEGEIPYYSTGDVNHDGSKMVFGKLVTMQNKPSRAGRTPRTGCVGFAKMKGTIKVIRIDEPLSRCVFSTGFSFLQPKEEITTDFLYFYLLTNQFHDKKNLLTSDGIMGGIKDIAIKSITIPVPPLEEQQRIVRIIDESLKKLMTSNYQVEQKILNASKIYQNSLSSIFAENGNWASGCLGDVTGGVQTGPFGSLLHKSDYIANGIPIVNPAHITETGIVPDEKKTVSIETAGRLSNYLLKPQYVVIGRRGEMGRCAVVNEKEDGWLCGTGSFYIKPSGQIDSHFLVKLLWSERYRKKLNEIATGATMKNLNNKALSNLVIEFPSITEQQEIISRLDSVYSEIEMLKQTLSLKSEYLDELKQSILQEAFNGNL